MKHELKIPVKVGFCKHCFRSRRHGSAYCGECQNEPERHAIFQAPQAEFPLLAKVVKLFKFTREELKNIVFTFEDTIYFDHPLSYGLIAHEVTHVFQHLKAGGGELWWAKYIRGKKFRLEQELEAYRNQYRVLKANDPVLAEMELTRLAMDLAGHMYGNVATLDEAREAIRGGK